MNFMHGNHILFYVQYIYLGLGCLLNFASRDSNVTVMRSFRSSYPLGIYQSDTSEVGHSLRVELKVMRGLVDLQCLHLLQNRTGEFVRGGITTHIPSSVLAIIIVSYKNTSSDVKSNKKAQKKTRKGGRHTLQR